MTDYAAAREAMVDGQIRPADVTRYDLLAAFLDIPRERFAPRAHRTVAYADLQIPLAPGRAMLDPRALSRMIQALAPEGDDLVLDVGAGTGYGAAILSRLCAAVVALEEDAGLAAQAEETLAALEAHNVAVERGALAAGAPASGPYDAILVEGAVEETPSALLDQLKEGGRLVAIVERGRAAHAALFVRAGGGASSRRLFDASAPVLPGFDAAPRFAF